MTSSFAGMSRTVSAAGRRYPDVVQVQLPEDHPYRWFWVPLKAAGYSSPCLRGQPSGS